MHSYYCYILRKHIRKVDHKNLKWRAITNFVEWIERHTHAIISVVPKSRPINAKRRVSSLSFAGCGYNISLLIPTWWLTRNFVLVSQSFKGTKLIMAPSTTLRYSISYFRSWAANLLEVSTSSNSEKSRRIFLN